MGSDELMHQLHIEDDSRRHVIIALAIVCTHEALRSTAGAEFPGG